MIIFFFILQVSGDKYGLGQDADVSLWLEKRHFDGDADLEEAGAGSFVLVTSSLHTEFDIIQGVYKVEFQYVSCK